MKSEEVKIYASVKFPIDNVQYAMGEIGGSWSVGVENGELIGVEELKKKALESLLQDMEKQLKERSQSIIENLSNEKVRVVEDRLNKKLELARQEYLKLKEKLVKYEKGEIKI